MKPQDIFFIIILIILLYKKKPEWLVLGGIVCILIAIPLFSFWIFFTAQRLVYYSFFLFLIAILLFAFKKR